MRLSGNLPLEGLMQKVAIADLKTRTRECWIGSLAWKSPDFQFL